MNCSYIERARPDVEISCSCKKYYLLENDPGQKGFEEDYEEKIKSKTLNRIQPRILKRCFTEDFTADPRAHKNELLK